MKTLTSLFIGIFLLHTVIILSMESTKNNSEEPNDTCSAVTVYIRKNTTSSRLIRLNTAKICGKVLFELGSEAGILLEKNIIKSQDGKEEEVWDSIEVLNRKNKILYTYTPSGSSSEVVIDIKKTDYEKSPVDTQEDRNYLPKIFKLITVCQLP